jgi:hypothetical protein
MGNTGLPNLGSSLRMKGVQKEEEYKNKSMHGLTLNKEQGLGV